MTDLLIPVLVAGGALGLMYVFCIRPMRRGGHGAMTGGSCCGGTTHSESAEIEQMRAEIDELRRQAKPSGQ